MPRKLRIQFPGAVYHVLDRGDRREAIFRNDTDRQLFLEALGQVCRRTGWRVHAFVLMGNHYHLLLETPEPNLVAGMKWFQGTYSIRFNCRHKLHGHVFQGRYKAVPAEPDSSYFAALSDYIHLNPVRAGMVGPEEELSGFLWSSYPFYLHGAGERPPWLVVERVLGEIGLEDRVGDRRRYARHMEKRMAEERQGSGKRHGELRALRRGWYLGGINFRERMLAMMDGLVGRVTRAKQIDGLAKREHSEAQAERLVSAALSLLGLRDEDLRFLKKNDERKMMIGLLVKERTIASNGWIAARLAMGDPSRVSRYCNAGARRTDRAFKRKFDALLQMSISTD